jgi:hypothetical protein
MLWYLPPKSYRQNMNTKNVFIVLSLVLAAISTSFAANKPAKELPADAQSWISRASDCLEAWRNSGTGPDPDVWGDAEDPAERPAVRRAEGGRGHAPKEVRGDAGGLVWG